LKATEHIGMTSVGGFTHRQHGDPHAALDVRVSLHALQVSVWPIPHEGCAAVFPDPKRIVFQLIDRFRRGDGAEPFSGAIERAGEAVAFDVQRSVRFDEAPATFRNLPLQRVARECLRSGSLP
jgi:hypothetical protein